MLFRKINDPRFAIEVTGEEAKVLMEVGNHSSMLAEALAEALEGTDDQLSKERIDDVLGQFFYALEGELD
jgi:hypothetical protein